MTFLKTGWDWLALDPHQRRGLRALQICLGVMLLFRVGTETKFAAYLWGPQGIGSGSSVGFLPVRAAYLADSVFRHDAGPFALATILGIGAAGLVGGWHTRVSTAMALVPFMFLEARLPELGDGGDNMTRLVLIYMLFALPAGSEPQRGSLAVWLHNVAILAIGLQILVLYFTSGFLKATGAKWSNGTAMYLISQVEWFSLPALRGVFAHSSVTTIATYTTVLFQIWFPIAVLTRLRLGWLAIGIALHVGIAVFMGLICFSTVMLGLEFFLVRDDEYAALGVWLRHGRKSLRERWGLRGTEELPAGLKER